MSGLVLAVMLQASVLSSMDVRPDTSSLGANSAELNRKSKARIENIRHPRSTAQAPLKPNGIGDVDEQTVVRRQVAIGNSSIRAGSRPSPKVLAAEPYPGCRKIHRSPMGVKLKGSNVTNGLTDIYTCSGYSALVTYMDVTAPIEGSVTVGFPEAEKDAVINSGAVSRSFYAVPGKGGRVTDIWIGKHAAMTVSVISNTLALNDLQQRADVMTEALSKSL